MLICVICRFQDDDAQVISDQYIDLRDAVVAALNLADLHGNDQGDGHGPPKRFDVCVNGNVELSVAVITGGLTSSIRHPE
jgi:hypothetical protein